MCAFTPTADTRPWADECMDGRGVFTPREGGTFRRPPAVRAALAATTRAVSGGHACAVSLA